MSNQQLAAGIFRAWAVVWAIGLVLAVPQFVNSLIRRPFGGREEITEAYFLSSQLISIGATIVIAVFLARQAEWLSSLVFPVEQELSAGFNSQDLQAVLFSAVGLYFLLDGLKQTFASAYVLLKGSAEVGYLWQEQWQNIAEGIAATALGALVLFRSRGGPSLWARVRRSYEARFGLRTPSDE